MQEEDEKPPRPNLRGVNIKLRVYRPPLAYLIFKSVGQNFSEIPYFQAPLCEIKGNHTVTGVILEHFFSRPIRFQ